MAYPVIYNSLCTDHILSFGNENQINKWIPKLASSVYLGAWGLFENNSGSDASGMSSTAVKKGDDWVLNGTKTSPTHGISGDIAVAVLEQVGTKRNATAFVIERGTEGFNAGKGK